MHIKTSIGNTTRAMFLSSIMEQSGNYLPLTKREKRMIKWFIKFCFSVLFLVGSWIVPAKAINGHLTHVRELEAQVATSTPESLVEVARIEKLAIPEARAEVKSKKKITAIVTAYSEFDSCHTGASCLMASGKKAYVGAIACPRNIRFGTRVIIDNIPYICEDRVSLKYPKRFDIFMGYGQDAYNKAISYGKQTKEINLE